MRTVDTKTDQSESWWAKVRGDLALAVRLLLMTIYYWTAGRKLRSTYRHCEEQDETFFVDDAPAEPERRLR